MACAFRKNLKNIKLVNVVEGGAETQCSRWSYEVTESFSYTTKKERVIDDFARLWTSREKAKIRDLI